MSFLNFRYTSELRKYVRDFGRSFRFYLVFIILIFAINVGKLPKLTLFCFVHVCIYVITSNVQYYFFILH